MFGFVKKSGPPTNEIYFRNLASDLGNQLADKELELERVKTTLSVAVDDRDKARLSTKELSAEVVKLNRQVESLNGRIDDLNNMLRSVSSENAIMSAKLITFETEIKRLRAIKLTLTNKATILENQLVNLRSFVQRLYAAYGKFKNAIDDVNPSFDEPEPSDQTPASKCDEPSPGPSSQTHLEPADTQAQNACGEAG